MSTVTEQSRSLRETISAHNAALVDVLSRYGASNPRLFGSVARGDAQADSDVDVLVDLESGGGNTLLRIAGIGEELSQILGVRVDVVSESLMRDPVSATALRDAVAALCAGQFRSASPIFLLMRQPRDGRAPARVREKAGMVRGMER